MKPDEFALLKVIESTMRNIQEDVSEIKASLKGKAELVDFNSVKGDVEDLKKSKWFVLGASGAISFIISHLWK